MTRSTMNLRQLRFGRGTEGLVAGGLAGLFISSAPAQIDVPDNELVDSGTLGGVEQHGPRLSTNGRGEIVAVGAGRCRSGARVSVGRGSHARSGNAGRALH